MHQGRQLNIAGRNPQNSLRRARLQKTEIEKQPQINVDVARVKQWATKLTHGGQLIQNE